MFGWLSDASTSASRWKRASRCMVRRELGRENLDGDVSFEPRVRGAIDLAHAAAAKRRDDLVDAQTCAGGYAHDRLAAPTC